ncbi:hypothetical protein DPEC_G00266060 [Dallia pectoralis]|uniref:Uncharacterized protein n=1 Tax=Dallia pectoralis TaxID=75939 RepID=A0ACC2FN87_DALPE|nr:hypothetical protein DPEC_G00266060 [Dallia pectoralis]
MFCCLVKHYNSRGRLRDLRALLRTAAPYHRLRHNSRNRMTTDTVLSDRVGREQPPSGHQTGRAAACPPQAALHQSGPRVSLGLHGSSIKPLLASTSTLTHPCGSCSTPVTEPWK